MKLGLTRLALVVPLLFAAGSAAAHTGQATTGGFGAGFVHPLFGIDHIVAMVAVGLWAAQLGGRALWLLPASFLVVMLFGGGLGVAGVALPAVELGIVGSVILLGVIIALNAQIDVPFGMMIVGLMALFHGFAHGAEIPTGAGTMLYCFGFTLATAGLHAAGVGLGLMLQSRLAEAALRAAGGLVAAFGIAMFAVA